MSDSERSVIRRVEDLLPKTNKDTKKRIKKEYNSLRKQYQGDDLIYEIASRVS